MIDQEEIDNLLAASALDRVEYCIEQIVEAAQVWVLGTESGFTMFTQDEQGVFPVWPYAEFAELLRTGEEKPEAIALERFLQHYLPHFKEQGYKIAIMPLPTGKGVVVSTHDFAEYIQVAQEADDAF
ncbi:Protein of unknown function [Chitinophaga costaii]|uniref:DUF2750 domain-containing protein n=1 Tax=Chitinophaga costaii TaxID=1335309 RepID=A0A1C4CQ83_9BACT|nr:DUF2750 domain-containing protein [Chitinophaga costaii]PUZ27001.1 DUF2750 domain-containing protein [Chitinophaga costaii]SCC21203.1 Protein of unknown function [Chitinophaga costaii]